jgi:ATP-dependent RNA helicase DDX18/HAS1
MVLDEVDFLLVDDTFGPQLRTVGVAVTADGGEETARKEPPQFLFVTATLPEDVLASIQTEFPNIQELRGPGLHRITPTVHQTLVDVSVPPDSNRDARACFDIKLRELFKALRTRRTAKTLVFCNTVETCRTVENALRRKDRKSKINRVWAYHNALSAEVRLKNLHSFSHDSNQIENGGEGAERILVCTDRAARGIDFDASPVDHVILFDFPKDPAEYVRRVGRTARAGRDGASTVFAYGWQLPIARQIMYGSGKGKGKKKGGKLEKFTMMNSGDGWVDAELEAEDDYYMKGGARRRREKAKGDEKRDDRTGERGQTGNLWKNGK